jgi:hypothetical protein
MKLLLLFCSIFFLFCSKQERVIIPKKQLPNHGNHILLTNSFTKHSESKIYLLDPSTKEIFELETNTLSTKVTDNYLFQYQEYLFFSESKNMNFTALDSKNTKTYLKNELPKIYNQKFLSKTKSGKIGLFDMNTNIRKEYELNYLNQFEWINDDTFYYVEKYQKPINGITNPFLKENKIYIYSISNDSIEIFYNSEQNRILEIAYSQVCNCFAILEINPSIKNKLNYSLKLITKDKKSILNLEGLNFSSDLKWSTRGDLAFLQYQKANEDLYAPKSIFILEKATLRNLLNLENLSPPGFVFGSGFKGVTEFTWSADGKEIAYISSTKNSCRMKDEGGNIDCELDVYKLNLEQNQIQKLTELNSNSIKNISWKKW